MDATKLIGEAEQLYEKGEHGEAVARLTSVLRSNLSEDERERVEELINKLGLHVFDHSIGKRGISREMISSFFTPSQSQHAQLGKLALLGTLLASSQKESEGAHGVMHKTISLLHGHHQSSGGGSNCWTSLASKFFGHNAEHTSQNHDTGTKSRLYDIASSYMAAEGGKSYMVNHQAGHNDGYEHTSGDFDRTPESNMTAVASNDHLSGHHKEGRHQGFSNLTSMASNVMGHGNDRHEEPVAYGDPNRGANGFDFTGGSHLAPL